MISLVFGTAFEVSPTDEILDHPSVRPYRMGGSAYVGAETDEILHVCDRECAMRVMTGEYLPAEGGDAYVSTHPYTSRDGRTVRTVDVVGFDPGDDPYVLCAACGEELLRDDVAYRAMFGRSIGGY